MAFTCQSSSSRERCWILCAFPQAAGAGWTAPVVTSMGSLRSRVPGWLSEVSSGSSLHGVTLPPDNTVPHKDRG